MNPSSQVSHLIFILCFSFCFTFKPSPGQICPPRTSPTISVKGNNLIETCSLGQQFQISFKLYITKFRKNRNILEIIDAKGKGKRRIFTIKTHNRKKKVVIKSVFTKYGAVTKEVALKDWNNEVRIIQHNIKEKCFFIIFFNDQEIKKTFLKAPKVFEGLEVYTAKARRCLSSSLIKDFQCGNPYDEIPPVPPTFVPPPPIEPRPLTTTSATVAIPTPTPPLITMRFRLKGLSDASIILGTVLNNMETLKRVFLKFSYKRLILTMP